MPPVASSSVPPPFKRPDRYIEQALAAELSSRLLGRSANGEPISLSPTGAPLQSTVWIDAGSEVLVHLDSVKTHLADGILAVSIDLECDQTGRTALVVVFALGKAADPAGLLALTDDLPRGNGILAARWGNAVQSAVWSALLGLITDYAAERNLSPSAFVAAPGVLQIIADTPLTIQSLGVTR